MVSKMRFTYYKLIVNNFFPAKMFEQRILTLLRIFCYLPIRLASEKSVPLRWAFRLSFAMIRCVSSAIGVSFGVAKAFHYLSHAALISSF